MSSSRVSVRKLAAPAASNPFSGKTMHVVFLDRSTFPGAFPELQVLSSYREYLVTEPSEVLARCKIAEIVISNKVRLPADVLALLPKLRLIAVPGSALDHVDLAYCRRAGITVRSCDGYSEMGIAEHAVTLMMCLSRNLIGFRQDIANGEWGGSSHPSLLSRSVQDLNGRVLGIVGAGILGRATARLARGIGLKVMYAERKNALSTRNGYVPFDKALADSDIVSLHCPLTVDTVGMFGSLEFSKMKPGALLINTARGGLIDELALLDALTNGRLGGAGLDVLAEEPPLAANPLTSADLPNLIITPHVAGMSDTSIARLRSMLMEQIDVFIRANQDEPSRA